VVSEPQVGQRLGGVIGISGHHRGGLFPRVVRPAVTTGITEIPGFSHGGGASGGTAAQEIVGRALQVAVRGHRAVRVVRV
jgi:hypothetical protein